MNKIAILIILSFTISACTAGDKQIATEFPIYGNWCGPNYPKAGNPSPIDRTDLACKNHDLCYAKNGYFNAKCDNDLIAYLKSFTPNNPIEEIARKAIISYFRNSPKR